MLSIKTLSKQEFIVSAIISMFFISIFAYSAYRTWNIALTHDEALTYFLVKGNERLKETANHHPINTILVKSTTKLFNNFSEPVMRLPNTLALAIYLIFTFLTIRLPKRKSFIFLSAIPLLVFNQYLLDFFSLARGYGLGIAFSMGAIYFLLLNNETKSPKATTINYCMALLFGILSSYSNYTLLNLNIAIFIIIFLDLFLLIHRHNFRFSLKHIILLFSSSIINLLVIWNITLRLLKLKENNEMYFGAKNGLIDDTLRILIHRTFYPNYFGEHFWKQLIIIVLIIVAGVILFAMFFRPMSEFSKIAKVFFLMIIAPILQYHLFGTLYPAERTSLIYIPIFGLSLYFLLVEFSELFSSRIWRKATTFLFIAITFLPITYVFSKSMNTSYILEWRFDSNNKAVIKQIKMEAGKTLSPTTNLSVSVNWVFEPSLNYYKELYNLKNITIQSDQEIKPGSDIIYSYSKNLKDNPAFSGYDTLLDFTDTRTQLIKRK